MNIIITGASKGIGRAIVKAFAKSENQLLICSRHEKELIEMVAELHKTIPEANIKYRATYLGNKSDVKAFAEWCLTFGVPDILINNAGQFIPGSIHSEEDGLLDKMLEINLYSAYNLTRKLLPSMMKRKSGHIFNVCSIAALQAYANGGSYSISKFALMGFSKNLREELKPYGIKVTAVSPGATMSSSWAGSDIDPKRIMEANDIATMIYAASQLSEQAVVEDIIMRPQLGDLN
jgi:short-subunit dehydrogenase